MQSIDNIEDIGIVTKINGTIVTVEMKKSGACESCAIRGMCMGKNTITTHEVETSIPLKTGDFVHIFIEPKYKLLSSFLLFIFPVLMMILTYLFCFFIFHITEKYSIGITFGSLIISGIIIYFIDKKCKHKLQIKITEKVD
jgi:positive regulator of sigma E activity